MIWVDADKLAEIAKKALKGNLILILKEKDKVQSLLKICHFLLTQASSENSL